MTSPEASSQEAKKVESTMNEYVKAMESLVPRLFGSMVQALATDAGAEGGRAGVYAAKPGATSAASTEASGGASPTGCCCSPRPARTNG